MLIRNSGIVLLKNLKLVLVEKITNSSVGISNKCSHYGTMRSIGPFGLTHRNGAGVCFSTYLELNNLVATTTFYKKNVYTTWTHPRSKLRHQIDHIITQKKKKKTTFVTKPG